MRNPEKHRTHRIGWLRAAATGANDGIVSTASLIVGVAAAAANRSSILIAGVAGLVAGAMSMAAGEYASVSSQSDTERADLDREREELATDGDYEHAELAAIYVARGLDADLANQVATQLTAKDAWALTPVTSWVSPTHSAHDLFRRHWLRPALSQLVPPCRSCSSCLCPRRLSSGRFLAVHYSFSHCWVPLQLVREVHRCGNQSRA